MKQNKSTKVTSKANPTISSSKRYKIYCTPTFLDEANIMAQKYLNIRADFHALRDQFRIDPIKGNKALGGDLYKVRMAISDKNKGKSAGARVIIKVYESDRKIYVLSVYDKSVQENLVESTLNFFRKLKFLFFWI
jgi:hypothetical protein